MAPIKKKIVTTPKVSVKKSKDRVVKRPARGFHRFRSSGMLNVTSKGGEKELVKSDQKSPLLSLPAKLRTQIWRYVLGYETLKAVWIKKGRNYHRRILPPIATGTAMFDILRCCRQIYAEAALLPYSLNTFTFWDYDRIKLDFDLLKPYQRALSTHIQFEATLIRGLGLRYGANMEDLATKSRYNLGFLSALQQVCVLVESHDRGQRNIDTIISRVEGQLDVLLAGRDIEVVFRSHDSTWSDYIGGWKTSDRIAY